MMALMVSFCFVGCSDDDDDEVVIPDPVLKIDSARQMVSQTGGTTSVAFTIENPVEGLSAKAHAEADWIKDINTETGGNGGKVTLNIDKNEAQESREANVTISYPKADDLTFKVIQPGLDQSVLAISNDTIVVGADAAEGKVGFEIANPREGAKIIARSNDKWISDFVYNTADNTLSFKVAANEAYQEREGKIEFDYPTAEPVVLVVKQAAAVKVIEPVKMTDVPVSIYQRMNDKLTNFYLVMTSGPYDIDGNGQVQLREPGFMIALDLYAASDKDGVLPDGVYRMAAEPAAGTAGRDYTFMKELTVSGRENVVKLADEVTVEMKDGAYSIRTSYTNADGEDVPVEYDGVIKFENKSEPQGGALPSIGHDVDVKGVNARAVYFGNLLESDTGMMVINIMDQTYADDNTAGQGGYAVSLCVFTQLFPQTNLIRLIPGTYKVATNFKKLTWMPGIELNNMGTVIPFGSYTQCDDGTQMGAFEFAQDGTITIETATTGYTIKYDLVSSNGYRITGSYDGVVDITDESNDKNTDDGTSTLTDDHDMDLSPISTARLYSMGDVEDADGNVLTHNRIDIGSRSGWDQDEVLKKGDTFTMDLVMEKKDAGKIAPGKYKVTTDRYPASMCPGAAIRGYIWSGEYMATGWLHYDVARPYDLYLDGHAAAYGGEIIVEKSSKGENYYKFTIDMICVRKMHVRGTWEGPVINAQDGSPVMPGTSDIKSSAHKKNCMQYKAVRAASKKAKARMAGRFCKLNK